MSFLNQRARDLKSQRENLLAEQRSLESVMEPLSQRLDVDSLHARLSDFHSLAEKAEQDELQRLLRLMVRRVDWSPEGNHKVQFYALPNRKSDKGINGEGTSRRSDSSATNSHLRVKIRIGST